MIGSHRIGKSDAVDTPYVKKSSKQEEGSWKDGHAPTWNPRRFREEPSWANRVDWSAPTDDDLKIHMKAYSDARHYHVTPMVNLEGILKNGLDPSKGGQKDGITAKTNQTDLLPTVQNKVHVGGDRATALYYERKAKLPQQGPSTLRVFITPDEKETLIPDNFDSDNYAYHTTRALPPSQVITGKLSAQENAKLRTIFGIVRMYYPHPKPSIDTVIKWHLKAMEKGMHKKQMRGPHGGYESE
jgi:hypothetical protein